MVRVAWAIAALGAAAMPRAASAAEGPQPEVLNLVPDDTDTVFCWGEPRSGSTFQFMAACVASTLKWPNKHVDCDMRKASLNTQKTADVNVVKSHKIPRIIDGRPVYKGNRVVVASTVEEASEPFQKIVDAGIKITFRVTKAQLARNVHLGIALFWEAFALSEEDRATMEEFMHLWDITRRCCGSQASKAWRQKLTSGRIHEKPYHECQAYDLDRVEAMLFDSRFVQQHPEQLFFPDRGMPQWERGMCTRSIEALQSGLGFNGDWLPAEASGP